MMREVFSSSEVASKRCRGWGKHIVHLRSRILFGSNRGLFHCAISTMAMLGKERVEDSKRPQTKRKVLAR